MGQREEPETLRDPLQQEVVMAKKNTPQEQAPSADETTQKEPTLIKITDQASAEKFAKTLMVSDQHAEIWVCENGMFFSKQPAADTWRKRTGLKIYHIKLR